MNFDKLKQSYRDKFFAILEEQEEGKRGMRAFFEGSDSDEKEEDKKEEKAEEKKGCSVEDAVKKIKDIMSDCTDKEALKKELAQMGGSEKKEEKEDKDKVEEGDLDPTSGKPMRTYNDKSDINSKHPSRDSSYMKPQAGKKIRLDGTQSPNKNQGGFPSTVAASGSKIDTYKRNK